MQRSRSRSFEAELAMPHDAPPPISSPRSVKRWREIGGPSVAQAALCVLRTRGSLSNV